MAMVVGGWRRVAAVLALWAMLFQGALSAFHHHDQLDHRAAVSVASGPAIPADGDGDDDSGCAVCQLLLALHAFTPPAAGGGVPAPMAVALRLKQGMPSRRRRQPRGPPAAS